jgi:hypothetical protein
LLFNEPTSEWQKIEDGLLILVDDPVKEAKMQTLLETSKALALCYAKYFINQTFSFKEEKLLKQIFLGQLTRFYGVNNIQELHKKLSNRELKIKGLENINEVVSAGTYPDPDYPPKLAVDLYRSDYDVFAVTDGLNKSFDENTIGEPISILNQFINEFKSIVSDAIDNNRPVVIFGNVAKGIFDAALITRFFERATVNPLFEYYRFSPYNANDLYINIERYAREKVKALKNPIIIIVDAFSSGGRTVPASIDGIKELVGQDASLYFFLSVGGSYWRGNKRFTLLKALDSNVTSMTAKAGESFSGASLFKVEPDLNPWLMRSH